MSKSSLQAAFGLFDDDSDDEAVASNSPVSLEPPVSLETLRVQRPDQDTESKDQSTVSTHKRESPYKGWEHFPPVFTGPIQLNDSYEGGGGRGYVAKTDLKAGTKLLVEEVFFPWPKNLAPTDPAFFPTTLSSILERGDYADLLDDLSHLFPKELKELPQDVLEKGRERYEPFLQDICKQYTSKTDTMTMDQLLQPLFAMQCNAFASGIFLHNAIFNHSCNPNCVKFTPEDSTSSLLSEVRLASDVPEGTPLTISYLDPREQSRESRQEALSSQFGFECNCDLCQRGDSVLPPPTPQSTPEETPMTITQIEGVVIAAEEMLEEDCAKALTMALEALSEALEIVAHDHIVLLRIHRLVADCCDRLLKNRPQKDVTEYMLLFLRSSVELLELQRTYLSDNHIDLARTLNDVSQGIQLLLGYDRQALLAEFPEWQDFREASIMENKYRQEYARIKERYE